MNGVPLEGPSGPATLSPRPRGLAIVEGSKTSVLDLERIEVRKGRLRDELFVDGREYRIPTGKGSKAAGLIADARVRPGAAYVARVGPFIEEAPGRISTWLSRWLDEGEDLLALLETGSSIHVESAISSSEECTQWFVWSTRRASLTSMHSLGDTRVDLLAGELQHSRRVGADRLQVGETRWNALRSNEDHYAYMVPFFNATEEGRRRAIVDLARHTPETRAEAARLIARNTTPLARLEAALLDGAPPQDDVGLGALEAHDIPTWVDAWDFRPESLDRLLETVRSRPSLEDIGLRLHAHMRARRLARLADDDSTLMDRIAIDGAFMRHLAAAGRDSDIRAILEERALDFPDEDIAAFMSAISDGPEPNQARIALLELEADVVHDGASARRHLARLQPFSLERLRDCSPNDERIRRSIKVLSEDVLSVLDAPAPNTVPGLDPEALEHLRHPVGRSDAVISYVQSVVAATDSPDVEHLENFAAKMHGEAAEVLARCAQVLGVEAKGYISQGRRARGCRAYPTDTSGFVVLGGEHTDAQSPRRLGVPELHFAIGSELAHLRFGHARATSSEVWRGAVSGGLAAVDTLLGAVPILQTWRLSKHLGQAVSVLRDERAHRVLDWAKRAVSRTSDGQDEQATPKTKEEDAAHLGAEGLVATHRMMQLTADRAGLVCCQDPAAAIRAMFRCRSDFEASDDPTAGRDVDWQRSLDQLGADPAHAAEFDELRLRIGSMLSFWLSDEYAQLVALPGQRTPT